MENDIKEIKADIKKLKNYFFWTLMITLAMVILPAIGLLFAIPQFLKTFTEINNIGL